jgi:hypothetical protein
LAEQQLRGSNVRTLLPFAHDLLRAHCDVTRLRVMNFGTPVRRTAAAPTDTADSFQR